MSGRVVHFEIPFEDGDRARSFYEGAFGWRMTPLPDMGYTLVMTGPTPEQGPPSEPGFINGDDGRDSVRVAGRTVDVEDIDGALESIEKLGGTTVIAKQTVGDMGFTAYFKDPEGNLIGFVIPSLPRRAVVRDNGCSAVLEAICLTTRLGRSQDEDTCSAMSLLASGSGRWRIAAPSGTHGHAGTRACGFSFSIASTIARTPFSVDTMNGAFFTRSFISDRM
jgi:predicted enzyme related to lactoylglutathione lyase